MDTKTEERGKIAEHLETSVEDLGPCKKKVKITVAAEHITDEFRQTYRKLGETVPVKGFRPGHVPRRLLEKKFGEDVVNDVRATVVPDAFEEAMTKHELVAIGEPEMDIEAIEITEGEALTFEVSVEVRPEFELGEYKGLEIDKVEAEVTDEDMSRAVENVLSDRATLVPAEDGLSQDRDLLVIDAVVAVGDEEVDSEENSTYSLPSEILCGLRVVEAPEKLSGRKIGDTETFAVTLPDHYQHDDYQGQEAEVRVTIQDIKRTVVPELDDELAKEYDFDDAAEFLDEVRSQVVRAKEREAETALEDRLLEKIIEVTPFELPEGILSKELGRVLQKSQVDMQMAGASEIEIAEHLTKLQTESEDRVKREFREALILEAIAEKERIFVTESHIREEITAIGARYGRSYEDMLEYFEGQDSLSTLRNRMRETKTREFIRRRAKIVDKES